VAQGTRESVREDRIVFDDEYSHNEVELALM
jgi:hypothetical protein